MTRHAGIPVRSRTAAVAVVLLLTLAGCGLGGDEGSDADDVLSSHLDVDTPALRAAKDKAGIEDCPADAAEPKPGGDRLPDVTLPCLGGGPNVNLSALHGPLVLNLWATWCHPCRQELPYYQRLHEAAGDHLTVLGVDYQDMAPTAALGLARQTGVTYPLLADPDATVQGSLGVRGLPVVVLVGRDGRVVHQQAISIDSYPQLRNLVRHYLDVRL